MKSSQKSKVFYKYECPKMLLSLLRPRNSRLEVFFEKNVLKNFAKVAGKHLFQYLFFNNDAGLCYSVLFGRVLSTPLDLPKKATRL